MAFATKQPEPVRVTREFAVPCETLFNAWLDPAVMSHWLFASPTNRIQIANLQPYVGGRFSILEESGDETIDHFGGYLQIQRPSNLSFTLQVPKHFQGVTVVDVAIEPLPNGCEMTLTQTGVKREVTENDWRDMFQTLSVILERGQREQKADRAH